MKNKRDLISALVGISFFIVGLTGILMKFVLKSHAVNEIHTWVGFAMVASAVVHLVLNWKPFSSYFARTPRLYLLVLPFVVFVAVMLLGTGNEQGKGGPAIFGKLAQGRVRDLAPVFGKSPEQAMQTLQGAGLTVQSADQTVQQIGQANHRKPEGILGLLSQ